MASLLRWISRQDRDSLQQTKYSEKRSDDARNDLPATYFSEILRFEPIPAASKPNVNYERDEAGRIWEFPILPTRGGLSKLRLLSVIFRCRKLALEGDTNFGDLLVYPGIWTPVKQS